MKLDKNIKNSIALFATSFALSLSLFPQTSFANEKTDVYIKNQDGIVVYLSNNENGEYTCLSLEQFDDVLEYQDSDVVVINGMDFDRSVLEDAKNKFEAELKSCSNKVVIVCGFIAVFSTILLKKEYDSVYGKARSY